MTVNSELSVAPDAAAAEPRKGRKNNPEKTRENILQEAIVEFVQQGLSGARVDAIAERIHTSKRMIYYYFGSKEQLYVEVLEKLYGDIRSTENRLHLDELLDYLTTAEGRRTLLSTAALEVPLAVAGIAGLSGALDEAAIVWPEVPVKTWATWLNRGKLPDAAAWNVRGRPQYRVGDLDVLAQRRASATRRGRRAG